MDLNGVSMRFTAKIAAMMIGTMISSQLQAQITYTIQPIDFGLSPITFARAFNDTGDILAASIPNGDFDVTPAIFSSGASTAFPVPNGNSLTPNAINDAGTFVGLSYPPKSNAFTPTSHDSTGYHTLSFPQGGSGYAMGINNSGTIVGTISTEPTTESKAEAVVWQNGKATVIAPPADEQSFGLGINNVGQVVGKNQLQEFLTTGIKTTTTAFIWQDGVTTTLPQYSDLYYQSTPADINDAGVVVGTVYGSDQPSRAAIWQNGTVDILGTAPSGTETAALAINDFGTAVGSSTTNLVQSAVVYQNQKMQSLDSLVKDEGNVRLTNAIDINERGQILAIQNAGGYESAYVLTPVAAPVPSALWLGLASLRIVWLARRSLLRDVRG